jgi:ribosomal protein L11 methyltransferase
VPYRIDVPRLPDAAVEALIDLGALDIDVVAGAVAAILPDTVPPDDVARVLNASDLRVSDARGRDDGSVWVLRPRASRIGSLLIAPETVPATEDALRLIDSEAFGTGLHATTVMCIEAIERLIDAERPGRILDVGTGSGILALAALRFGVHRAVGLDISDDALRAAAANAQLNGFDRRLLLVRGAVACVRGGWPLVVANIRAADLIEMAPMLVRRVASKGHLVLSGIANSVAVEVEQNYRRAGMKHAANDTRGGWTAIVLRASW